MVVQQISWKVRIGLAALVAVFAMTPMLALAAPYGCGSYGGNTYNDSCPATSTATGNSSASNSDTTDIAETSETTTPTTTEDATKKTTPIPAPTTADEKDNKSNMGIILSLGAIPLILLLIILAAMKVVRSNSRE